VHNCSFRDISGGGVKLGSSGEVRAWPGSGSYSWLTLLAD
jgi:hypothetical protein